jgi:hypothetical protein
MGRVALAIRTGQLLHPTNFKCVDCGDAAVEYDHRDYNKPLHVDPVCRSCNLQRGPAIPTKGCIARAFQNNRPLYRNKKSAIKLFSLLGINADLSSMPKRIQLEHWLPYRDQLLASECPDIFSTKSKEAA